MTNDSDVNQDVINTDKKVNVKNLADKRREKAAKAFDGDQITQEQVFEYYAKAISHEKAWNFEDFPQTFRVILSADGVRLIVEIDDDNVARYVTDRYVAAAIIQFKKKSVPLSDFWITTKKALDITEFWTAWAQPIPEPSTFTWKSNPEVTFRRLPFDYDPSAVCPEIFKEMLDRTSNVEAFVLFIGSLLDARSYRQQYLWLYGEGGNGKGAINQMLFNVFGKAYYSLKPPTQNDRFWNAKLAGIRVGVFPDCASATYVTSGDFKILCGNDPIDIERKGKDSYTKRIDTKFIFLSNEMPVLSSEKADLRRAIFCHLANVEVEEDPNYDVKIWEAAGPFLSFCRSRYEEYVTKRGGHGPIPVTAVSLEGLTSEEDDYFEGIFSEYFEQTKSIHEYAEPHLVAKLLNSVFKEPRKYRNFLKWINKKYQIERKKVRVNGGFSYKYLNLKIKNRASSPFSSWESTNRGDW